MNKQKPTIKANERIRSVARRFRFQFSLQPIIIVVGAVGALMLMTWLIRDVLRVENIYAAAGFEALGIMFLLVCFLVPFNIILYRRRVREVETLSNAIQRVAGGDFESRIPIEKNNQITPIYEDFNKMCDEIQSVQILRNDFINNYSHEFKTPIASIKGFAELLMEKEMSQEDQKEYLRIIADESGRLANLASNTTLLSRLSSQQIVTNVEAYDLSAQLAECSILLSGKWMAKNIDFEADLEPVVFTGDKGMMQHLWINLYDNAIKYTPEGGRIMVSLEEEAGIAEIRITDTGEGISDETKARLFIPYFQGDASRSREGLGLGLSICQRIIELCDGSIKIESQLGQGSTFVVKLPIRDDESKF